MSRLQAILHRFVEEAKALKYTGVVGPERIEETEESYAGCISEKYGLGLLLSPDGRCLKVKITPASVALDGGKAPEEDSRVSQSEYFKHAAIGRWILSVGTNQENWSDAELIKFLLEQVA